MPQRAVVSRGDFMSGYMIPIRKDNNETDTIVLPKKMTLAVANMIAADLIDAEGPLEVHEINTEVVAFSLKQDGMYEYNSKASFVLEQAFDILAAFEGDIVLYILPEPEVLSR